MSLSHISSLSGPTGLKEAPRQAEILLRLDAELRDKDNSLLSLNSSAASEWFDNTHDEMILFEKFGENYEDVR